MTDQPQRRPPRGSEQGLVVDVADTLGGRELITLDNGGYGRGRRRLCCAGLEFEVGVVVGFLGLIESADGELGG